MSRRAKTKQELLDSIQKERSLLENKYAGLTKNQMIWPGAMEDWSAKDILAHLVDWEQRLVAWYQAGLRGETPEPPAPGMTWRELPRLNEIGYQKHKDETLDHVMEQYHQSYQQTFTLIQTMSEEEIFEPGYYPWTGKSALLSWIAASTSSHYAWARRNIRTTVIRKGCPE